MLMIPYDAYSGPAFYRNLANDFGKDQLWPMRIMM